MLPGVQCWIPYGTRAAAILSTSLRQASSARRRGTYVAVCSRASEMPGDLLRVCTSVEGLCMVCPVTVSLWERTRQCVSRNRAFHVWSR